MRKLMLALGLLLAGSATGSAQDMRMPLNSDDVKWMPAPNVLPAGAQIAIISGDPFKEGLYVVRLKMPGNAWASTTAWNWRKQMRCSGSASAAS